MWKPTKYNQVKKQIVDGISFDSKKEARAYLNLKLLEKAGKITNIELQPVFELQKGYKRNDGKKIRPITYIADFKFYDVEQERLRVIDTKGWKTEVFKIKEKIFNYINRESGLVIEYEI